MAKKKKGKKQADAAEEVRAFDSIDIKNQGQMLDALKDELGVRANITTEAKAQLNVSRKLQSLGQQVLDNQLKSGDSVRKHKDITKDLQNTLVIIDKLEKQTLDKRTKAGKIAADQKELAKELQKALKKELDDREKIDKKIGSLGSALKGISQIPIVGNLVDTEAALGKMEEAAKDGASQFGVMKAGVVELGTQIKKHVTDPFVIAIAAIKAGFQFDKETTNLARDLGVSRDTGLAMRQSMSELATDLHEMAITSVDMTAGFNLVNNALGTSATIIRADIVQESGRMQKLMGMSEESIAGFASHALRSGKDMKQIKLEAIGQVKAMEKEYGARLNIKKVLEEAGKVQGQISAQLGGDPARIGAAIAKAQELGMSLEDVAAAGKSMLNFEESIAAELEAELLTGKQLNLEKARLAALTGDYETLTEEINENVGDFGDFSKMNVLQQEALAKSVGMTADQLSNQLLKKADLKQLAEEARAEGDEETAQMLEQRAAQEEFNDLIVQLKQTFVDLVGGPVGDFLKGLMKVFGLVFQIVGYAKQLGNFIGGYGKSLGPFLNSLGVAGKLLKGLAWIGVVLAAYKAYAALATLGPFGVAAGLASSIAILAAGNTALNAKKADDAIIGATPGYGKRALLEKGSVTLFNDKDTIVAGTNLNGRKANDATFSPEGSNTATTSGGGGEGGGQPMQINVEAVQQNDVFANTNKNTESFFMVQTKSEGLFA